MYFLLRFLVIKKESAIVIEMFYIDCFAIGAVLCARIMYSDRVYYHVL